jgi:hypothetical protein
MDFSESLDEFDLEAHLGPEISALAVSQVSLRCTVRSDQAVLSWCISSERLDTVPDVGDHVSGGRPGDDFSFGVTMKSVTLPATICIIQAPTAFRSCRTETPYHKSGADRGIP